MVGLRAGLLLAWMFAVATAANGQSKDAEPYLPSLVVPSKINKLRFGDPVFLPIEVRNDSDEPVSSPSFALHDPPFRYFVECGAFKSRPNGYGNSFGGGQTHMLNAHSAEATVMRINIWTPETSLAIAQNDFAVLKLELYPKGYPESECVIRAEVKLEFDGSALNDAGKRVLLDRARRIMADPDLLGAKSIAWAGMPGTSAFSPGQSPVAWLDARTSDMKSWCNPDSELYRRALSYVEPDSGLFRMLRFRELIDVMRGALHRSESGQDALREYFALLGKCSSAERHYYLMSLNEIKAGGLLVPDHQPNITWSQIRASVNARYPAYGYYLDNTSYSKVSPLN